jgi:hypothetical protein
MQGVLLLVLTTLSAEPAREAPRRAEILVRHPLYQMQPGRETDCVGILRKDDKGAYFLELQTGREPLVLFPDAGDPLAPFVGKRIRLSGKQVIGLSGLGLVRHTLPGRLEVLAERNEPEDLTPPDRTRQEEDLGRIEEEIRKRQEERKRKEGNPDKKNELP